MRCKSTSQVEIQPKAFRGTSILAYVYQLVEKWGPPSSSPFPIFNELALGRRGGWRGVHPVGKVSVQEEQWHFDHGHCWRGLYWTTEAVENSCKLGS